MTRKAAPATHAAQAEHCVCARPEVNVLLESFRDVTTSGTDQPATFGLPGYPDWGPPSATDPAVPRSAPRAGRRVAANSSTVQTLPWTTTGCRTEFTPAQHTQIPSRPFTSSGDKSVTAVPSHKDVRASWNRTITDRSSGLLFYSDQSKNLRTRCVCCLRSCGATSF